MPAAGCAADRPPQVFYNRVMTALRVACMLALLQAAPPKHLTVVPSASATSAAAGAQLALYVDVAPNPGIHVYAPGTKDFLPIVLKVNPTTGVTVGALSYPKSQTLVFEGQKVPVYDKPFRLTQRVTLDRSLKAGETVTLTGAINYQACNDQVCFIPASAPVRWSIAIN
jgi:DsbC/DsbD-like thiol-disulfide interchange protein